MKMAEKQIEEKEQEDNHHYSEIFGPVAHRIWCLQPFKKTIIRKAQKGQERDKYWPKMSGRR
jgi:hypothetical protein